MKQFILSLIILTSISFSVEAQEKVHTMKVAGTCGMCKKRIEDAAIKSGASKAEWDKKSKMLQLVYDSNNVNEDQIKKSIAEAGHDNENYKATNDAYSRLHDCCKYDRSDMNEGDKREKCKTKKKCCKMEEGKKCHRENAQSSCMNHKGTHKKRCCKED